MTRQTWDLLSTLLYGRPGEHLPDYVARRAAEIDVYLRDMRLPADSPIVIAHAEGILANYRQEQRDAEQWETVRQALDAIKARLDRIERRLQPPRPATAQQVPKAQGLWAKIKAWFWAP